MISSDGSFTPPVISDPTLVLRASYGDGHESEVDWEWAYQVGELAACARSCIRHPVTPGTATSAAERSAAAWTCRWSATGWACPGTRPAGAETARLGGMDDHALHHRDCCRCWPASPGWPVEVTGEPADYREAGDSLRIGVSTGEVAGDTDWFDLGVTITVEGREVPFADLFLALGQRRVAPAAPRRRLLLAWTSPSSRPSPA